MASPLDDMRLLREQMRRASSAVMSQKVTMARCPVCHAESHGMQWAVNAWMLEHFKSHV